MTADREAVEALPCFCGSTDGTCRTNVVSRDAVLEILDRAPAATPSPDAGEPLDDLGAAWREAEAALPEYLDERSLSFWFDTGKPSGWRAAASHRFDPLRPIPLIVKGFDTPAAALRALAATLTRTPPDSGGRKP